MELGHGVLIMLLFSVLLNVGIVEPQRVSLVDRLKALDKGIRQGLQRQKSTDPSGTNPATDQQQVQDEVQPVTIEEQPTSLQQQVLSPEDTDGTSDVVRQLTASYEDDVDDQVLDTETSKEGNLEMDDGSAESKKRPLIKPTKYHYYPHNQHLYLLPECATQQVCNAVYTRFNFTQPLCACADRFQGPCSASIARNDLHTIEVGLSKTKGKSGRAFKSPTLVKTCEETKLIRDCRAPQDWALLALQNVRTGKSQYLVICRCDEGDLDGPMSHDQPAYARVPGIRVYGMMCNSGNVTSSRSGRTRPERSSDSTTPEFPWEKVVEFSSSLDWN